MTAPTLRLGIIGAGTIAELHTVAIERSGHRLVAVCDVRRSAAERLAQPHGAAADTDHRVLLAREDIDAVIITVPHALHAEIARDALDAGKHVLVEKPVSLSRADAVDLIDRARRAARVLAVGHVLHFVPSLLAAEALIAEGRIGRPSLITERRASNYADGSRPAWFFDPALAGGGIVLNVGTHAIDRIQWFGRGRIRRVYGVVASRPGSAVETEAGAVFELDSGVRASLTVTGTGLPFTEQLTVVGERGALTIDRENGIQIFHDGLLTETVPPVPEEMTVAFTAQMTDFAGAIRDGRAPRVDGEYALSVLDAALAIYRSAERNDAVDLPGRDEERAA